MERSPRIESVSWGRMEVEGMPAGKDFKLYPGGGREWDWNETGTRHDPGIQPADVQELLDRGATTVVLSRGMEGQLRVDPATVELLRARGVTVHEAETTEAVRIYNDLVGDGAGSDAPSRSADAAETDAGRAGAGPAVAQAVGGLFHSTC